MIAQIICPFPSLYGSFSSDCLGQNLLNKNKVKTKMEQHIRKRSISALVELMGRGNDDNDKKYINNNKIIVDNSVSGQIQKGVGKMGQTEQACLRR